MIFHENRLLADDSHVISYLIFVKNWEMLSAAVVIGALRINSLHLNLYVPSTIFQLCKGLSSLVEQVLS